MKLPEPLSLCLTVSKYSVYSTPLYLARFNFQNVLLLHNNLKSHAICRKDSHPTIGLRPSRRMFTTGTSADVTALTLPSQSSSFRYFVRWRDIVTQGGAFDWLGARARLAAVPSYDAWISCYAPSFASWAFRKPVLSVCYLKVSPHQPHWMGMDNNRSLTRTSHKTTRLLNAEESSRGDEPHE